MRVRPRWAAPRIQHPHLIQIPFPALIFIESRLSNIFVPFIFFRIQTVELKKLGNRAPIIARGNFINPNTSISERNRANAQHSTGPRTPEGKAVSSQNARKHLFSVTSHRLLDNEDPEVYEAFQDEILEIYEPQNPRERLTAIGIAQCRWALRRFDEAEITLLNACLFNSEQSPGEALAWCCILDPDKPARTELPSLDLLQRYRRPWDRRHQEAIREFDRARMDRHRERRLAMAEEREAMKLALQREKLTEKETKAAKEEREMRHIEMLLGFHPRSEEAATGFVSSNANPAPPAKHKTAAA